MRVAAGLVVDAEGPDDGAAQAKGVHLRQQCRCVTVPGGRVARPVRRGGRHKLAPELRQHAPPRNRGDLVVGELLVGGRAVLRRRTELRDPRPADGRQRIAVGHNLVPGFRSRPEDIRLERLALWQPAGRAMPLIADGDHSLGCLGRLGEGRRGQRVLPEQLHAR
eukprot:scaffold11484_cov125-Isochrysis_galbana.AAC.2